MTGPYGPTQQYGYPGPPVPPAKPGASVHLRDVPLAIWIGLGLGVAAFVIHFSFYSYSSHNGVQTSCSYLDLFGFIAAAGLVACVAAGWTKRARMQVARRLATPLMVGLSAVLLALAVVHLLRGIGTIGGMCQ